ncbi:MAG TPA: hypothetical protein VM598_01620 [Bdellovibrionota bacterium]|nr:hypothetical protein [Bdellovibrionota bacterium]
MHKHSILVLLAMMFAAVPGHAATDFDPGDLSSVTDPMVNELLKMSAVGTGHRPIQPASALGLAFGLVIGVEVSGVVVTDEFKTALTTATQRPASDVPGVIPVPRISIHKGLPKGFDLGFSWAKYQDMLSLWGLHAAWNFRPGGAGPALGARMTYSKSKLYFIDTHYLAIDAVASKNLVVIEPYVGTGFQQWGGTLDVPAGGATGLPVGVSGSQSGATAHVFGGIPLKLLFIHITGEIDYSFSGITTYGGKLSLSF